MRGLFADYVVHKKVDKSGDKEVVCYYAASKVVQPEPVSNKELAERLAERSSIQTGDAQSVLVQLPDIIVDYLANGRTVNIKGLGNFFPAMTSELVERIEDCTADKVRITRICFRASKEFMAHIYRYLDLFSMQVQDLKKELKKKSRVEAIRCFHSTLMFHQITVNSVIPD